jgi:AAA domain
LGLRVVVGREALGNVVDRLKNVRQEGGGYRASCPVPGHGKGRGDPDPSLTIKQDDGRVLINCFAGCEPEQVVEALDLSMADLFDKPPGQGNNGQGKRRDGKPSAFWEIRDRNGEVQAEHVRFDKPGGKKECSWKLPGVDEYGLKGRKLATMPLYRTELIDDWPEDMVVVLTEGEKAADALARVYHAVLGTVTGAGATPGEEALEPLRGRRVLLWSDADVPGRMHMQRIGKSLQGIASEVRVYEPEGMSEGEDAADYPAVVELDEKRLLNEWSQAPIYSRHTHEGFGENKLTLPIKTVEELLAEASEETPWVIENLLAPGAVTDFSGKAKQSGKTTFWCHAIKACAEGEEHAGFRTVPAKYLYLTEQGNNFANALRDSGLSEFPDYVRIVQFKDVTAVLWEDLIRQAGAEAKRRGMDVLIVDTFAIFARLKGSEENDSGPVGDKMRVLREIAQKFDLAVVLIRHAGKDGTPRGSSAFEAEADICVTLSRPEGRHDPRVRRITGIGRYGEWERNVQLVGRRFISLGTDSKVEFIKAVKFIKSVLPDSPEGDMKKQDLMDRRTGEDEKITARTMDRALAWLVEKGDVGEQQMMHQRGKPKVYWNAYNPPGGDASIHSRQSPSSNGENKSKGANQGSSSSRSPDDKDDYEAGQDGAGHEVVTRTPAGTPPLPTGEWEEV